MSVPTTRRKARIGPENGRWSETPTPNAGRLRARRQFREPEPCRKCGTTDQLHRHHIDGNPTNNVQENIAWLCASCHTKLHREAERRGRRGIYRALAHVDEWVRRFEAGETVAAIAAESEFGFQTVRRWLSERGVFVPYRSGVFDGCSRVKLTAAQVEEIRARIAAGEKQRDIATSYGVSEAHISGIKSGRKR